MYYHPLSWLKSLDDTPAELFRSTQRKNVDLRMRINNYFDDFNKESGNKNTDPPAWDIKNIIKELPSKDLLFLSAYDFTMEIDLEGWILGRSDNDQIDRYFVNGPEIDDGSGRTNSDNTPDKTWSKHFNSNIWSWLLDGSEAHVDSQSLQKLGTGAKSKLEDSKFRKKFSEEYHRSLLEILTDSVRPRKS
jgi:hypothetical protein